MATIITIGILVHFLGPLNSKLIVKIISENPSKHRKLLTYINPQRGYDITTITAAIICTMVTVKELTYHINSNSNLYGLIFSLFLGVFLPMGIWKMKKKTIIFNGRNSINIDSLVFLPLTAMSEELIWRFCVPLLFLSHVFHTPTGPIIISSIGFIMLHLPLGGIKTIAYMSLFTFTTVIMFLNFGIISSIIFHIAHNLIIQLFHSSSNKTTDLQSPPTSQSEW